MQTVEINRAAHNESLIPAFLLQAWIADEKFDPFEEEVRWNKADNRSCFFWVLGIALPILWFFGCMFYDISQPHVQVIGTDVFQVHTEFSQLVLLVPIGTLFVIGMSLGTLYYRKLKNHERFSWYYEWVVDLFNSFGVVPGEAVGKLSREQFRAYVESALRKKGAEVDGLEDFAQIEAREQFKEMHEVALAWGLCHEDWGYYFPKKVVES